MQPRTKPARRVYYDWDELSTSPDARLGAAFEMTRPGAVPSDFEDEPTHEWLLPALAFLVVGFFVGHWWMGRKKDGETVLAGDDFSGFDELGCE